ncbi:recombinase family protein [Rhodobacter capsulatus]|uniref:recombinase family protein n=1 Tax=Rhodobacter capsulatus TaxID=1061 RepID=UPI003B8A90FA
MTQRVALYARVSTDKSQTVETQLRQLHEVATRLGWIVVAVHTDGDLRRTWARQATRS